MAAPFFGAGLSSAITRAANTPSATSKLAYARPTKVTNPYISAAVSSAKALAAPKKTTTTKQATNPYDVFDVQDPYNPKTIQQTAQTGYNTDIASATKTAAMGYLTPAQLDAQAANRSAQEQALASSLADQIGRIQVASVAGTGATQATVDAADAAANAAGARQQGVAGTAPTPTGAANLGTQAVLASQGAGNANVYGGLEAAAYSSGNQNAEQALRDAETLKQTNAADEQKGLAALISSIASPSTRSASMIQANSTADAANKATELSVWNGIENRRLTAQAEGDKTGEAAAALEERQYEAQLRGETTKQTTTANNAAKIQAAKIGAAATTTAATTRANSAKQVQLLKTGAAGGAKPMTASAILALNKSIAATIGKQGGVKTPGQQVTTGYKVTLAPPADALPNVRPNTIPVSAAAGKTLKAGGVYGPTGQKIQAVAPTLKTGSASVTGQPSTWTKWKRALGLVMTETKLPRTQAVQYLAAAGFPAPPSK